MTDADDEGASRPRRAIEEIYVSCLDARNLWIREASSGFPNYRRDQLHGLLHAEVMNWYEALAAFLEDREQVERFWTETPLWPVDYVYVDVLWCPACTNVWDDATLAAGDGCPNCGRRDLKPKPTNELNDDIVETRIKLDEETREPEFVWVRGLESLREYRTRTTTETKTVGTFRKRTITTQQPERLQPDILLRVGRLLDQAADRLNLIANVEVSVPTTTVDEDTLDEAREQIQQLVDEHSDADPYEGEAAAGGDD